MSSLMPPEREAELRADHRRHVEPGGQMEWCNHCTQPWPCDALELLDALAAERAHAQQAEVPHTPATVLGYVGIDETAGHALVLAAINGEVYPSIQAFGDDWGADRVEKACAVVRVGTGGRIA